MNQIILRCLQSQRLFYNLSPPECADIYEAPPWGSFLLIPPHPLRKVDLFGGRGGGDGGGSGGGQKMFFKIL